jgi:hypothetical protein
MDFIERLLHISPDGGDGSLEFLLITTAIVVIIIAVMAARRSDLLGRLSEYLKQLGKREGGDRFDN